MKQVTLMDCAALVATVNAQCNPSFIQAALPVGASVNFVYPLKANSTFQTPKGDTGYPANAVHLPALCAVSVQVQSLGNSTYGFGLFLPDDWNQRFLAVGNGGFAGGINWLDMVSCIGRIRAMRRLTYVERRYKIRLRSDVNGYGPQFESRGRSLGLQPP
jgi:feruloyl esterase